jgi:tyrosinase
MDIKTGGPMIPPTPPGGIHNTGVFLPWHRYAVHIWEDAIRSECGWEGGQPCKVTTLTRETLESLTSFSW